MKDTKETAGEIRETLKNLEKMAGALREKIRTAEAVERERREIEKRREAIEEREIEASREALRELERRCEVLRAKGAAGAVEEIEKRKAVERSRAVAWVEGLRRLFYSQKSDADKVEFMNGIFAGIFEGTGEDLERAAATFLEGVKGTFEKTPLVRELKREVERGEEIRGRGTAVEPSNGN